jgi:hypothetical protein
LKIDITEKILSAISVTKRNFDEENWIDSWSNFIAKEPEYFISWDDPGDLWIEIAYSKGNGLAFIYSRLFPFVFCTKDAAISLEKFKTEIYPSFFFYQLIESLDSEIYKIDFREEMKDKIIWHTESVDPNNFSIRDFLYATH